MWGGKESKTFSLRISGITSENREIKACYFFFFFFLGFLIRRGLL